MRIERLERLRIGPLGVKDRQNMGDPRPWWPMSSSSPQMAKDGKEGGFMAEALNMKV